MVTYEGYVIFFGVPVDTKKKALEGSTKIAPWRIGIIILKMTVS